MKILFLSLVLIVTFQTGCKQQKFESVMQASFSSTGGKIGSDVSVSAKIRIVDQGGAPINGATVLGDWSGVVTGSSTAVTDASGYATLVSSKSAQAGNFTLTIANVSKAGSTYDSSKNTLTSKSITH